MLFSFDFDVALVLSFSPTVRKITLVAAGGGGVVWFRGL